MTIVRKFLPGEEWLYIKIYGGPNILEAILINELHGIIEDSYSTGILDKFFFVRFLDDTGYHLRIRFHLKDSENTGVVLSKICQELKKYVDSRLIHKMAADTYNRELERYGEQSIQHVESLFHASSLQIINILKATSDYSERWLTAVKDMDVLLDKFDLTLLDKYNLYESYFELYSQEFGMSKSTRAQLKIKYREEGKKIGVSIEGQKRTSGSTSPFDAIIEKEFNLAVMAILKMKKEDALEVSFDALLKSILHMHYNRLFKVRQRFHEFVLYHLMSKFYNSAIARHKNDLKPVDEIPTL